MRMGYMMMKNLNFYLLNFNFLKGGDNRKIAKGKSTVLAKGNWVYFLRR